MLCTARMRAGFGGELDACMCTTDSLHSSPETTTTLSIGYIPRQNKKLKFEIKKKEKEV